MTDNNDSMNILLVGNNPRELTDIYSSISAFKSPSFKLEVAFDLRNIFRRIRKFKPATILIDDRLNHRKLNRLIKRIHRNAHTHDIPVTILKSSNVEFAIEGHFKIPLIITLVPPASLPDVGSVTDPCI